ncbi:hypothetical protein LCGC14_2447970 [marine sediment metagenome]|uniref:Uncharacterized protein n=1 Tax=marine sediment metagenome TaxID=412755 RepID=A0A0F9C4I2_9ZZZZ
MSFKQLFGSTTQAADGKPTRVYETLAVGTHRSPPWRMGKEDQGFVGLEIDTSDGSLMIASAFTLQRSSIPQELGGLAHPTEAAVHWHDVPAAEATLTLPNADGHETMYEWSLSAAAMYRLEIVVSTEGNIWAAATPGGG